MEALDRILEISPEVRAVISIDLTKNRLEYMKARREAYIPQKVVEEMFPVWAAVGGGLLGKLAEYLGRHRYIVLHFEKADLIVIGLQNRIVQVIVDQGRPADTIAKEVWNLLAAKP